MISPYSIKTEATRKKIMEGKTSYCPNKYYKNRRFGWYWYVNIKGFIHIVRPCEVKYNGKFSHFEIKDLLLKTDDTIKECKSYGSYRTVEQCIAAIEENLVEE